MKTTQHLDHPEAVGTPARPTEVEEYDLLILGSGAAGKLLSWTLAWTGMKTAVIERKYIGGSCPNIAWSEPRNTRKTRKKRGDPS
jgi:succinate dehydrogenase/fumarate reductase flavoprotein subunit